MSKRPKGVSVVGARDGVVRDELAVAWQGRAGQFCMCMQNQFDVDS